ncbi:MAG: metallophosphoesterase [Candidatus Latescibacteria bacterium]|nr:metallophosphoesterase [Candidatus Latescibacterota bacterium]
MRFFGALTFRLILCAVLVVIQGYLYLKLRSAVRRSHVEESFKRRLRTAVLPVLLYLNLPWMYIVVAGIPTWTIPTPLVYGLIYPCWVWMLPSVFLLFPIFLIKDLSTLLVRGLMWCVRRGRRIHPVELVVPAGPPVTRRQFLRYAAVGAVAAPIGLSTYGAAFGMRRYEVVPVDLPCPGLPAGLSGFRILQVSDIHSNLYMDKPMMDEIVAKMNDVPADLIVLTGDYVSSSAGFIYPFVEAFSALKAPPYGIYATLGNHDFWTNADVITAAIRAIGIPVLRNETAVIPVKDVPLNLVGIDYGGTRRRSPGPPGPFSWSPLPGLIDRALQSAQADGFSILLSHNPSGFDHAIPRNIPLTLAGHTHGGQVILELPGGIRISPAALAFKYIAGLYQQDGHSLYVNRGCGVTGPPIRLNCPPELTLITLKKQ